MGKLKIKTIGNIILITIDFVIIVFPFLFTIVQLNDPIDVGYFPAISNILIWLQVAILLIQSILFYKHRKSTKNMILIAIFGVLISLVLFGISEAIILSVNFN